MRTARFLAVALVSAGLVVAQSAQAGAVANQTASAPTKAVPGQATYTGLRTENNKIGTAAAVAPGATSTSNGSRVDVFQSFGSNLAWKFWTPGQGWQGWIEVGAPAVGIFAKPAATWTADGTRLDVLVTGFEDGHPYQNFWTASAGWSGWVDLGGEFLSAPTAQWTSNGTRLDLFGIGVDERLYQRFWTTSGGWSGWFGFAPPAAGFGTAPSATWSANATRLDVFAAGADGHLNHKAWRPGTGWSGWVDLGGVLISAPSASWIADGSRIDVFAIGSDERLYQRFWSGPTGWSGWFGYNGPGAGIGSSPSIAWAPNASRLDVFLAGASDGFVYQKLWTGPTGWNDWVNLF